MDIEEFKFLIHRITILSDKASGMKAQNKLLQKRISSLEYENQQLEFQNQALAEKVTELNHKLQKCIKENDALRGIEEEKCTPPNDFHGQINIKELKR